MQIFDPSKSCRIRENKNAHKDIWLLHGFTSQKEHQNTIANYFFRRHKDYNVIQCDARGHGSRKDGNIFDWKGTVNDFSTLINNRGNDAVLIGHSMGGTEAIVLGDMNPHVKQVFSVAGGHGEKEFDESIRQHFINRVGRAPTKEEENLIRGGLPENYNKLAKNKDTEFFLIHSKGDQLVDYDHYLSNKKELGNKITGSLVYDPKIKMPKGFEHAVIMYKPRTIGFIEKNLF